MIVDTTDVIEAQHMAMESDAQYMQLLNYRPLAKHVVLLRIAPYID